MLRPSMVSVGIALAVIGCSKSSSDNKPDKQETGSATATGSAAATGSGSDGSAAAEPVEAATVVGPTRSASGTLEVTGSVAGSFEWKKKDQKSPISCAWDAKKEIGGTKVDVSDGAGKLLSLAIDVPPEDLGLPRLDVSSSALAAPLKTSLGFNVSGDDEGHITVKFNDTKLGADAKKPDLTIKGTLEVTCPKKN